MKPKPSIVKREREKAKRIKQQEKLARRADASARRATAPDVASNTGDADIAGIVPGPQPPPGWMRD
jgi:hypothetical protein